MQQRPSPLSLCCIAAPTDLPLLMQWENHLSLLRQKGLLTLWSEQHIPPGAERWRALTTAIDQADLIVFLLSADFFASEECRSLMELALHRHQTATVQIIPLLVRPVLWQETSLGTFSCLPANGIPVSSWGDEEEGWHTCTLEIFYLLEPSQPWVASLKKQDHSDRGILLSRLRQDYQRDLDTSLERLAWQELGLVEQPAIVRNATRLSQRCPDQSEHLLPMGIPILQVYDGSARALLILGAPGAGKSTLLTRLALDLVVRAESEPTHPLPVIVSLSSWAEYKEALEHWLVKQLTNYYEIPRLVGERWLQQNLLILLLDGLDEMDAVARPRCIAAINTFRRSYLSPLVVCSRTSEYQDAAERQRLVLQNAIIVQPLSSEQIIRALQQGGDALASLREALTTNGELWELATSPLMLSVLVLAYHGKSVPTIPRHLVDLERQIWNHYVTRMLTEKGMERSRATGQPQKRYTAIQTRSWLTWMAWQMREHNRTWFYGEALEDSWLPTVPSRIEQWILMVFPAMLLGAAMMMLLSLMLGYYMTFADLIQQGLIGSFLGWFASQPQNTENKLLSQRRQFTHMKYVLLLSLLVAGSFGFNLSRPPDSYLGIPPYTVQDWLLDGVIWGGILGGCCRFLQFLQEHFCSYPISLNSHPWSRWSRFNTWRKMRSVHQAMWVGIVFGIGYGLSAGLTTEPGIAGLGYALYAESAKLGYGLAMGLGHGLIYGLSFWSIRSLLQGQATKRQMAERISWKWNYLIQWSHLRESLLSALGMGFVFGLSYWLSSLSAEVYGNSVVALSDGLDAMLHLGIEGGVGYWLVVGLYRGLQPKLLEEHDRRQFNQGLRRSSINISILSLLGAGYLAYLILNRVYLWGDWQIEVLFVAFCGWAVIWTATGGLTILRHYTLRLLLARRHTFPLHARPFLDDAVARVLLKRQGGGYSFIHRRLLNFFADTATPMTTNHAVSEQAQPPSSASQHKMDMADGKGT